MRQRASEKRRRFTNERPPTKHGNITFDAIQFHVLTICFKFNCVLYGKWNHKIAATLANYVCEKHWTCVVSQKFANLVKHNSFNCFVILAVCLLRMQCFRSFFSFLLNCVHLAIMAMHSFSVAAQIGLSGSLAIECREKLFLRTITIEFRTFASYCSSTNRLGLQSKCLHEHWAEHAYESCN